MRDRIHGLYLHGNKRINEIAALLLTVTGIFIVDYFKVPNPAVISLIAVVYSTFVGGFRIGGISSLLTFFYCSYYFSNNHSFFLYTSENLYKILIILVALVTIVTMVGILKRRIDHRTKELENANRNLLEMAISDGLTGLYNYRHFIQTLEDEWRRTIRTGGSISLAILDIDYFKRYNDYYGHNLGNACIKEVADIMKSQMCRPGDFVARYGGEEFVVILPDTDNAGAKVAMEKIMTSLKYRKIEHKNSEVDPYVTVSIGITTKEPSVSTNSSFETIVTEADSALYAAKDLGRNRIISYGDVDFCPQETPIGQMYCDKDPMEARQKI